MLPEAVTSIDRNVFYDCTALTEVILPRNLKAIPTETFRGCKSLTSFSIPGNIETIESGAFQESGLTSINIPLGVKSIGNHVFSNCANLTKVTIPSSIEEFGDFIFVFCEKLKTVYVHEKHKTLEVASKIFMGTNNVLTSENLDDSKVIVWTN